MTENMAVVTMTPPLEICQTLLATILRAIYDNSVAIRSMIAGNNIRNAGALGFSLP
jgi:hypothetical protein